MEQCYGVKSLQIIGLSFFLMHASGVGATSFQSYYGSAAGLGDAYSAEAASADDASTAYYNPAGLVRLHGQQVVVASLILEDIGLKFKGTTVFKIPTDYVQTGSASYNTWIPWIGTYYSRPLSEKLVMGIGVNSPIGIGADFAETSIVRYISTHAELFAIDISPSLGYQLTSKLSVGVGADIERFISRNDFMMGYPGPTDGKIENKAYDWGYGWHGGVLYQFTPQTRVGYNYHSRVLFNASGTSRFIESPGGLSSNEFVSNNFKVQLVTPPISTLSIYHDLNPRWAVMGTVDYTQWDYLKRLTCQNVALGLPPIGVNDLTIPLYYHNSWRVATGAHYRANSQWLLRGGVAFDQKATNNSTRTVDLPGTNAAILALGARYQVSKPVAVDVGYAHYFYLNNSVATEDLINSQVGSLAYHQDTLGAQVTLALG